MQAGPEVGSYGTGVTGSCELPDVGAGSELGLSARAVTAFDHVSNTVPPRQDRISICSRGWFDIHGNPLLITVITGMSHHLWLILFFNPRACSPDLESHCVTGVTCGSVAVLSDSLLLRLHSFVTQG